ncbi:hypothetical protein BDV96DRAFT_591133 [Lophiotrema nucula]|uniref:Uncharacterized protein n=1 Tax=Lophiotrema nucula TaxID=690887 RepID=A0A6A5YHI9_9PLEO|nr:hypothetical protein BDV96DRAFT_591133 [Lophiotrema nucula]
MHEIATFFTRRLREHVPLECQQRCFSTVARSFPQPSHHSLNSSAIFPLQSTHMELMIYAYLPCLPSCILTDIHHKQIATFKEGNMSHENETQDREATGETKSSESPKHSPTPNKSCRYPFIRRTRSMSYVEDHHYISEIWLAQEENGMASPLETRQDEQVESSTEKDFLLPPNDIGDSFLFHRVG